MTGTYLKVCSTIVRLWLTIEENATANIAIKRILLICVKYTFTIGCVWNVINEYGSESMSEVREVQCVGTGGLFECTTLVLQTLTDHAWIGGRCTACRRRKVSTTHSSSRRGKDMRSYARDKGPVICEEIGTICSEALTTEGDYLV